VRSRHGHAPAARRSAPGLATAFRVDALTTEQNFEGTGLGDQIVFTTRLLKGGTEVWHQGGVCTVTSVQRGEAQCIATYAVRGGQITGQAPIRLGDPAPYAVAITGGSGKYRGVEGEIRVISATERNRGVLTFHLEDCSVPAMKGRASPRPLPASPPQPSAPPLALGAQLLTRTNLFGKA
jgi:hypothetical protein